MPVLMNIFAKGSIGLEDPQRRQEMIRLLEPIVFSTSRVGLSFSIYLDNVSDQIVLVFNLPHA
jgi:hypothetical protein